MGPERHSPADLEQLNAELAASEARLRSVMKSAIDVIITANDRGEITYANDAVKGVFGYHPDDLIGKPLTILMPEQFHDLHNAGLARFVATHEPKVIGKIVQLAGRHADGTEFPIELSLATFFMDGHDHFTGILRDVSTHIEALEREREIARRLDELNQLKNEFVGIVAHDLKSPMTVISGFADLLVQNWNEFDNAQRTDFLTRISDGISRLAALVDDVLEVARIESGEVHYDIAPFDLGALVRSTVDEITTIEPERQVCVTIPDDLPPALGDNDRQWRVLTNLLSNALKFSPAADVIHVEVVRGDGELMVCVRDSGPGIAPEDMTKLFQKFSRVGQAGGDVVKGTGLGLYICRSLIEGQGGRIWAESEAGEGTTFRYTVPIAVS